ncbi:MAG: hypothetical protein H7320_17125 [Ferruginibacter sp.]|nr:hypothetical protein [Ferruginibacter sp.]
MTTSIDFMRVMIYTKMKKGFDQYLFYSKTFSYAEEMADFDLDFELFKVVKSGDYEYSRIVWKNTYCETDPTLLVFIIKEFFILKMKDEIFLINIKISFITATPTM